MARRIFGLVVIAIIAVILLYLSRFWIFNLWGRDGLAGIAELRPDGGLLRQWLRGTPFAPFELLIWAVGAFLILTWLQRAVDMMRKSGD